jgi:adsorption protein B
LVISGIDDTFIDSLYWLNLRKYKKTLPTIDKIKNVQEHSIALVICAWKEYRVIERTLQYAMKNIKYSNYQIFVGLYPNDTETIKVIRRIAEENKRVYACINDKDGPTTKADNLNNVYSKIKIYEAEAGKLFDIILIHDSEDFIHPLSLKLFNYSIMYHGYDAAQIPVIPIKDKRGKLIHRTSCDAFAEVHSKDLIVRQSLKVFLPFAGTGMCFKRGIFTTLENKYQQVFNEINLTEDYELGLKLYKMGYKVRYINMESHMAGMQNIIATQEYFPNKFWAAVKQRSRWTAGICFQNWTIHKWEGTLKNKYFLLRDRKTIFSNLMIILSNTVFVMFILYVFHDSLGLQIMEDTVKTSIVLEVLLWCAFGFMLSRLLHRFIFTYTWYGYKYAAIGLIRIAVDNVINFFATLRAIKVFMGLKQKIVWESTEHY